MRITQKVVTLSPRGPGLHLISQDVARVVSDSGVTTGLCHVFIRHTSASLLIQENADPSARHDIEAWFRKLARENDPEYTHTSEGPDDMPSHLRAAVTSTSELIPVVRGMPGLGTWQGLYLFEHRKRAGGREIVVTVWGE